MTDLRRVRLLFAFLLPLALGGCLNAADFQAIASDTNAVCISVTTLYGSFTINRNHGCDPAGAVTLQPIGVKPTP